MKNIIKSIVLFLTIVALSFAAPASVTANATYVSEYVFRGQTLAGASLQPAVEVNAGNFTFGAWNSTPLKTDGLRDESLETDFYGSYAFTVSPNITVTTGATYYVYPRAITNDGSYRSTLEPSLGLTYNLGDVTVTPKAYYDVTLKSLTGELTANHTVSLKAIGTQLDLIGTVGTYKATDAVNGSQTKSWGNYWLAGVSAPFQVAKNAKLTVGYAYSSNWSTFSKIGNAPKTDDGTGGHGVVSVGLGYSF